MKKFKVGDKVKIIKSEFPGEKYAENVGKVSVIEKVDKNGTIYPYKLKDIYSCWGEHELELVKESFTKADLKDGDIVTYRNGWERTFKGNQLFQNNFSVKQISDYNDDLTDSKGTHALDIVKVERAKEFEVVYERKEEILDEAEKKYLSGIIAPFRNKVKYIEKFGCTLTSNEEFISINLGNEDIDLPNFKSNTMYKGMEVDKEYTLDELGL